mmetsp:Transcript_16430/g.13479  ORF Transcript_16430/g.13479 Transcript_16430/m.13479 type:complete len:117 (-) Transcript_16430:531-881(-)
MYFKIQNIWFMIVYVSKNNTKDKDGLMGEDNNDDMSTVDEEDEEDVPETTHAQRLHAGRQQILQTIKNLFQTQNQVVLLGDWNSLKDSIVEFMEDLQATRLDTGPSFSAKRNGAEC